MVKNNVCLINNIFCGVNWMWMLHFFLLNINDVYVNTINDVYVNTINDVYVNDCSQINIYDNLHKCLWFFLYPIYNTNMLDLFFFMMRFCMLEFFFVPYLVFCFFNFCFVPYLVFCCIEQIHKRVHKRTCKFLQIDHLWIRLIIYESDCNK